MTTNQQNKKETPCQRCHLKQPIVPHPKCRTCKMIYGFAEAGCSETENRKLLKGQKAIVDGGMTLYPGFETGG